MPNSSNNAASTSSLTNYNLMRVKEVYNATHEPSQRNAYNDYAYSIASRASQYGFHLINLTFPYGIIFVNDRNGEYVIYPENEPEWGQPPAIGHDSALMMEEGE